MIKVIKVKFDESKNKYQLFVLSDENVPVNSILERKDFSRAKKQLHGFYFVLINYLFSHEKRFDLVDKQYFDFFLEMSSLFNKYQFLEYEQFQESLIDGFRHSLNASVGISPSIKGLKKYQLHELVQNIIEKSYKVGINLDEFLANNKIKKKGAVE